VRIEIVEIEEKPRIGMMYEPRQDILIELICSELQSLPVIPVDRQLSELQKTLVETEQTTDVDMGDEGRGQPAVA